MAKKYIAIKNKWICAINMSCYYSLDLISSSFWLSTVDKVNLFIEISVLALETLSCYDFKLSGYYSLLSKLNDLSDDYGKMGYSILINSFYTWLFMELVKFIIRLVLCKYV